jgi:hypothetical protein
MAIIIIINLSAFDFECLEEFEDTKRPIRICKSQKDRQHNGQKKIQDKRTNNDLQNIHIKTGVNSGAPEGCACSP